jgi:hypothetical protein
MLAYLKDHLDSQEHCLDEWCPANRAEGDPRKKHCLCWKTENPEMCSKFKECHEGFVEMDKLVQLFHGWDTNSIETFKKVLTKFLQKDRTYCNMIENKARIHLALAIKVLVINNSADPFLNG